MSYKIQEVTPIHEGWCRLVISTVLGPDGTAMRREIEDHGAAACVLPYDPERGVALLIQQFRTPVFYAGGGEALVEAPAGLLDDDDPETCVRREAMEETGLALTDLERVTSVWALPGISTEYMHLYLARYAASDRTGEGGGVASEHENITVLEVPLAELAAMADDGRLADMKTFALVQTLRLRHPELF